jgi:SAM-dependent methyltransferase
VDSYARLTRNDPNPLKRWLQRRRLDDALAAAGPAEPLCIVDYGGGDGALTAMAAERWPDAELICFEPAPRLAAEARALLAGVEQAEVMQSTAEIPDGAADLVLCTEVFEHLPEAQTAEALAEIERLLMPGGRLVIGVPVEIGPPALLKGLFRMIRRPGAFDARPGNILGSALGRPPAPREEAEIAPGLPYFPHHTGFDHRALYAALAARFGVEAVTGSPFPNLPLALASEVYFTAVKAESSSSFP